MDELDAKKLSLRSTHTQIETALLIAVFATVPLINCVLMFLISRNLIALPGWLGGEWELTPVSAVVAGIASLAVWMWRVDNPNRGRRLSPILVAATIYGLAPIPTLVVMDGLV